MEYIRRRSLSRLALAALVTLGIAAGAVPAVAVSEAQAYDCNGPGPSYACHWMK